VSLRAKRSNPESLDRHTPLVARDDVLYNNSNHVLPSTPNPRCYANPN